MVHQAVGQAFINSAPILTHIVHNAVIKTLGEGTFQGYTGPCYMQPGQMNFAPIGSTTATAPSASNSRPENSSMPASSQTTSTTLPSQTAPIFTTSPSITASIQGGAISGFPAGWNPVTGLGMPPGFFVPSAIGQNSASATQPMSHQQDTSLPQMTNQVKASATQPMAPQQNLAVLVQPITPIEVLI